MDRLSLLATMPEYKGDAFGTRGDYNTGMHYAYRSALRSNPGSPTAGSAPSSPPPGEYSLGGPALRSADPAMSESKTTGATGGGPGVDAAATSAMLAAVVSGPDESNPHHAPDAPAPLIRRSRARSVDERLDEFLGPRDGTPIRIRGVRAGSPDSTSSQLPQQLPDVPTYGKPGIMTMADFVSRNGGFDAYLLGPKPQDGARYMAQALGIREILTDDVAFSPTRTASCAPQGAAAPKPETAPSAILPPTSPVMLRAGIAARLPPRAAKNDLYWKPLAKQDRSPLMLDADLPERQADPLADLLRDDPPDIRRLKRGIVKFNPDVDLRALCEPAAGPSAGAAQLSHTAAAAMQGGRTRRPFAGMGMPADHGPAFPAERSLSSGRSSGPAVRPASSHGASALQSMYFEAAAPGGSDLIGISRHFPTGSIGSRPSSRIGMAGASSMRSLEHTAPVVMRSRPAPYLSGEGTVGGMRQHGGGSGHRRLTASGGPRPQPKSRARRARQARQRAAQAADKALVDTYGGGGMLVTWE